MTAGRSVKRKKEIVKNQAFDSRLEDPASWVNDALDRGKLDRVD